MVAAFSKDELEKDILIGSGSTFAKKDSLNIVIAADERGDAVRVVSLLKQFAPTGTGLYFYNNVPLPVKNFLLLLFVIGRNLFNRSIRLPKSLNISRSIAILDSDCEQTIIDCLSQGARHVFNMHESDALLQARLEAALQRHREHALKNISVGNISFDVGRRQVLRSGQCVSLSPKEYELARYLFSQTGEVVSNAELMISVWSLPSFMDTRRIDTAACHVRKKLALIPCHGWELKKIRCVGYRLRRLSTNVVSL